MGTVTFNTNGGTPAPAVQTVAEGGKVTAPAAMTRTGYTFDGWYKEPGFTSRWNFSTGTVTANITLYAKWIPIHTYGDGISFTMVSVSGGHTFPTGANDNEGTVTVAAAYEIGETEVTYELWSTVRNWAEDNGYTFDGNPGNNTTPGANNQEPVTMVNWFDAVVWLNALTEWVNVQTGSGLTPVYYYDGDYTTVANNSDYSSNFVKEGGHSLASAYAKPGTTGFRLPTSDEWELAARWRNDGTNTVSGYTNPWFTKGNSASGATAIHDDTMATGLVAWYNNVSKTQTVKGKNGNALGLYDMSGNVSEWCFDWVSGGGDWRIKRGGDWRNGMYYLSVGRVNSEPPDNQYNVSLGFRPVRTVQ
jgi:uncharacterized repeat protein (TIGR02543 family)